MKTRAAFFVTGTDTEIGKTLVSSALIYNMAQLGWKSIGMKPVAAGAFLHDGVWCNEDVMALNAASNVTLPVQNANLVNPYLFKLPIAPHIAAQQESRQICLSTILDCYQQLTAHAEAIVVEGVGGFKIPFNAKENSADLAQQLNLPVILVVGMRLGCINHALLTAEAIAARGLTLAGWVANSVQKEMPHLLDNVSTLSEHLEVPLIGCIPHLDSPTAQAAIKYLNWSVIESGGWIAGPTK